ncbi:hypothetical protein BDZ45DRAFT_755973 [Acephala macrosclerotiorum]|nr:hypothetical protein BDZ45DRAFT_755973 [Acephala macrosclerotiorum]
MASIAPDGAAKSNFGSVVPKWATRSIQGRKGPHAQGSMLRNYYRPTDDFHHRRSYQEGVVFSTVVHEHDFNQSPNALQEVNRSETSFGFTNSKSRNFIVIGKFQDHVLGLPIYTYGGKGLQNKSN